MKQPTYQQVSELYHELWQLQRDCEELEKKCNDYKEAFEREQEFSYRLLAKIKTAREYLKCGDAEKALEELCKEA